MKKWFLGTLLLALLLCGCGKVEEAAPKATPEQLAEMEAEEPPVPTEETMEPSEPDPMMEEPGKLTIRCGSASAEAMGGSYSWWYDNGDGTKSGIEACGMHPLDAQSYLPALTAEEGQAKLQFEGKNPDHVTICSWSTEHWGNCEAEADPVAVAEFTFPVKPDSVYEITAQWSSLTGCGGTAYYAFYTAP